MKNKKISKFILGSKNIDLDVFDPSFLNKSIQRRWIETNCVSENEYQSILEKNPDEVSVLSDSLIISYSEFFRNPLTFSVLEKVIIPQLKQIKKNINQKEIRIWSSACASGQEIYSLAILLHELASAEDEQVKFRIFATDYSQDQIAIAQKGQYYLSDLNNITLRQLDRWFDKTGNQYRVKPVLKEAIYFSAFDLLDPELSSPPGSIFGAFDLVFCANVLFYYKPEYQKCILNKIRNSLTREGCVVTGETEREILSRNHFKELYSFSGIFKNMNKTS